MANQLVPVITNAGREALMSGFSRADNFRFSHVALGDGEGDGYFPNPGDEELKNEIQRVDITSVVIQDHARLHITAVVGTPDNQDIGEYNIHEIGFFLQAMDQDGKASGAPILFALYATDPGKLPLLAKDPQTELLLAFDLVLPDVAEGELKFDKDSYLHLPLATQAVAGMLQIANKDEVVAGENENKAVTPSGLKLALDQYKSADDSGISQSLKIAKDQEILFADNGQVRSLDNNHRILFRRKENILELREYGKIIFSPGAKKGAETAKAVLLENGDFEVKGKITAKSFDVGMPAYNPNHHRMYPDDPIVYQNIFEALKAGAIAKLGKPHYDDTTYPPKKKWYGKPIIRFGSDNEADGNGASLQIPDGYNTVWIRVLGERWTVMKAYFLDGKKEDCGLWSGGYRANNCYCPDGSLSDGHHNGKSDDVTYHQWVPIAVKRSGKLAIVVKPNTSSHFWISGVAFSKNPWAHAAQSAVTYHWKLNGGSALGWHGHNWNRDVLAKIEGQKKSDLLVPVVANGRDKLFYVVEHDNNWNGCIHTGISVNGKPIERFLASYDNPFARHWNSKFYQRYIGARIPAELIPEDKSWLKVQIDMTGSNKPIYFREAGTHDLTVPVAG